MLTLSEAILIHQVACLLASPELSRISLSDVPRQIKTTRGQSTSHLLQEKARENLNHPPDPVSHSLSRGAPSSPAWCLHLAGDTYNE